MHEENSPAENASKRALDEMYTCLQQNKSFRLEAGAGAGKTYSLIKALQFLIEQNKNSFARKSQKIACITFTNVAKDEILTRTDRNPLIFCETNHAFCWSLINNFQKKLRELIQLKPKWKELIEDYSGSIANHSIEYNVGHRFITDSHISLHHDDILPLTIDFMQSEKFLQIMANRFPIILVDEYQDTDRNWIEAIKEKLLQRENPPLFGFFGDHWQKIYGNGCGKLEHANIIEIGKQANFRSCKIIVDCLNRIRPELPQFVDNEEHDGQVHVFHTNDWKVDRQTGAHWAGDLPSEASHKALNIVKQSLEESGWDLSPSYTKILMLTHRLLAGEQGYPSLPGIFKYNEAFAKKEHDHISFFVDKLEPACEAFSSHKYGLMFEALEGSSPLLHSYADKLQWHKIMTHVIGLRSTGTVGQIIDYLRSQTVLKIPDSIERNERRLQDFDESSGVEMTRSLKELKDFRDVSYSEIIALQKYLVGHSPFETKHGVKGAEFENVLVVIGRGWSQYNFGEMLELMHPSKTIPTKKEVTFERNRNLFYVACSRPQKRLAILFTQKLSNEALEVLQGWFGERVLKTIPETIG